MELVSSDHQIIALGKQCASSKHCCPFCNRAKIWVNSSRIAKFKIFQSLLATDSSISADSYVDNVQQFLVETLKEIINPGYLKTTASARDLYSQFPKQAQDFS